MDENVSYQFAPVRQRRENRQEIQYELILRQQPKQSRMCGIGEKADRRPIDPPPIIQLKVHDPSLPQAEKSSFLQNPYFFMYASLMAPDTNEELHLLRDGKTRSTTGSVVSSLYHLKDIDNSDAGFFVFPDLSVRMEGTYRLKLSLFEIIERDVYHCKSIFSEVFIVYSAKRFPGMEESTFLSRSFADQGLKIRIRKEIRIRRRLAKRKELEPIECADSNRMKRSREDRLDNDSHESSDLEITDHIQFTDEIHSKRTSDLTERRKDRSSKSPSSSYIRGPYDHIPHIGPYDHNAPMYGPGYPPHRPIPWHDRPEYMSDPHYPPYYDLYDRRYSYHPYYYPPPLPDGPDHHRYPYPHPPTYGRPPIYPSQPGYYDTPPRMSHSHSSNESSSTSRPYGYEISNSYPPPRPWSHYGERPSSRVHSSESSSSSYRSGLLSIPPRHSMYSYPEYYHSYPPPPPKQDYNQNDSVSNQTGPAKIPIQDLLSTEQQQLPNAERNAGGVPSPRTYGAPPSAFAHLYPHPGRPHEYSSRHDLYSHSRYSHETRYPPHESLPHYGQIATSNSPSLATPSRSDVSTHGNRNMEYVHYDHGRRSYSEQSSDENSGTVTPSSVTSPQQSSSYNGGPMAPIASRSIASLVTLPSLTPLSISDRADQYASSSTSSQNHLSYQNSISQQKSLQRSQHSSYELPWERRKE
ncbi:30006_t:CDS:2 [Gigaspora margarita]|uniref:30006_t:CDS:1 n=1 Tax=Gigaspora margarita TaxID=4874 RepID=A0ABN7URI8_GIGMA|nr:30006_t:CDS:2 [Gigaspora margarita]